MTKNTKADKLQVLKALLEEHFTDVRARYTKGKLDRYSFLDQDGRRFVARPRAGSNFMRIHSKVKGGWKSNLVPFDLNALMNFVYPDEDQAEVPTQVPSTLEAVPQVNPEDFAKAAQAAENLNISLGILSKEIGRLTKTIHTMVIVLNNKQ